MDAFSPLFKYIRTLLRLMKKRKEVTHQSIVVIDRKVDLRGHAIVIKYIKRTYSRHCEPSRLTNLPTWLRKFAFLDYILKRHDSPHMFIERLGYVFCQGYGNPLLEIFGMYLLTYLLNITDANTGNP